ncbi:MAG TPA: hypothetical protein VE088_09575 [Gaiellaceae bacterium]|nr:hypothetical protein [Gaiellaceae bacterium]
MRRRTWRTGDIDGNVLGQRRGDAPLTSSTATPSTATLASGRQLLDVLVCGALAAAAAWLVLLVAPAGGDLAAHVYRTELVRHGILVWDNFWFAGDYPLSSYSLLYYPLAAVVGNTALAIAGVVVAASFFASVVPREWPTAGRLPALAFAVLLAGQVFTAAYPFDLGLAMLMVTLWALQRGRRWLALPAMLATLGFSPLAFLFLALALLAVALRGRRLNRTTLLLATAVAAAGGAQLGLLVLLPTPALVFPYGIWRMLAGLVVAGLGAWLSLRGRAGWPLASLFLVWAVAGVAFEVVPSPVGRNILRASVFVFPLMLVAAARAGWRPRWLALTACAVALASNVLPYTAMIPDRSSSRGSKLSFWQPVIHFLDRHEPPRFRVEVVETANHWENYFLPEAGFPLARGWYVQLDIADNRALYAPGLTAARYTAWLRARAVRYVVLPHLPDEKTYGGREAALLGSGHSGLREVWSDSHASIYELPHATPLLTGRAPATVTLFGASRIAGRVTRPGVYLLRVAFNPYWKVERGSLCLSRAGDGATLLHARRAGRFAIKAIEAPGRLLAAITGGTSSAECPEGK